MNELNDIVKKLYDEYGSGQHWEITHANRQENGSWELTVRPAKSKEKTEGAENENN